MDKINKQAFILPQQHKRKSKSQDNLVAHSINQINLSIFLSHEEQINVPVYFKCPLKIINSLIQHKVGEYKQRALIGFQSVPSNYSFDYRLKKNIGLLNQYKNITLNCVYRNSSLQKMINKQQQTNSNCSNIDESTFYKINKYKICKPLSSGGFSRVYLVRNLINGQFYAAKFMQKCSNVNIERADAIKNQFFVHKALDHPYIVRMEEYIETQQFFILIMEYCPGGQLFTLLKNNRYMGQEKAKLIFIQVLLAIKYLHQKNIVFRDIKPQNILIDQKGNAKLTDFGLAKQIRGKTNSYCGSVQYMAPQIVSKQFYSLEVDLYCMGALLYQILIGCPPFYNPNFTNNQTKYHICNSEICFPNKVILSDEVKDLIASLLTKNPSQRLGHNNGVQQIFQHQWIGDTCIQTILKSQVQCPFIPNLQVQNFDRQQDEYEQQFRNKIFEDMRRCKRMCTSINVIKKFKFNSQIKNKSISCGIGNRKHLKSKSQQQFSMTGTSFSSKINAPKELNYNSLQNSFNKMNPYKNSLVKKNKNELLDGIIHNRNSILNNNPNKFKKKSSHHRSLSRSTKNPYENGVKQQIKNIFLINSKSCLNSRKNSLHKNERENIFVNKQQFLSLKNKKKQFLFKKSNKKSIQVQIFAQQRNNSIKQQKIKNQQKSLSKVQNSCQTIHFKSNQFKKFDQFKRQKQNRKQRNQQRKNINNQQRVRFQKQNDSKGLKRKNVLNKKKFVFGSIYKDTNTIKSNNFIIQNFNWAQTQNRQSVM